MFILVERKCGERIVADSAAIKFRMGKDKKYFYTEGPRNAYAKYNLKDDIVEFTESVETCIKFIKFDKMDRKTLTPLKSRRRLKNKFIGKQEFNRFDVMEVD